MIELINVSKYYPTEFGRHYVFRDVSLLLPLDKSVGVLGPNGSGKSTFLRLLGGADAPSEGKIIKTGSISPPMGLTPGLQNSLTASENMRFAGRIYGLSRDEINETIEFVRQLADIGKFFDLPVGTYSAGMKQRVSFAVNMSLSFDYYLFDEIGAGGDKEFRKITSRMVEERLKTSKFIVVSHRVDELLELCDAGIILQNGELTYYDDIREALTVYGDTEALEKNEARRQKVERRKEAQTDGEAPQPLSAEERKEKERERRQAVRLERLAKEGKLPAERAAATVAAPPEPAVATAPAISGRLADVQQERRRLMEIALREKAKARAETEEAARLRAQSQLSAPAILDGAGSVAQPEAETAAAPVAVKQRLQRKSAAPDQRRQRPDKSLGAGGEGPVEHPETSAPAVVPQAPGETAGELPGEGRRRRQDQARTDRLAKRRGEKAEAETPNAGLTEPGPPPSALAAGTPGESALDGSSRPKRRANRLKRRGLQHALPAVPDLVPEPAAELSALPALGGGKRLRRILNRQDRASGSAAVALERLLRLLEVPEPDPQAAAQVVAAQDHAAIEANRMWAALADFLHGDDREETGSATLVPAPPAIPPRLHDPAKRLDLTQ